MSKQNKEHKLGFGGLAIALVLGVGTLAACGEEPTSNATAVGVATSSPASTALSPVAPLPVRQLTFPPLILAEPVTTTPLPNLPAQNSAPVPATTLPILPSPPSIDGAASRPTTPAAVITPVADSYAGRELVGKSLQKSNPPQSFQLTVKRVERLSRIRDSAGKYYAPSNPNGVFLLVLYDVRNNGSQPMAYAEFGLRDGAGSTYKVSSNPQLVAAQKNYKLFWDTPEVKPASLAQQYRIFELPKNAANLQLID